MTLPKQTSASAPTSMPSRSKSPSLAMAACSTASIPDSPTTDPVPRNHFTELHKTQEQPLCPLRSLRGPDPRHLQHPLTTTSWMLLSSHAISALKKVSEELSFTL
eukprot:6170144-Amphidinium_carterae.1